MNPVAKRRKLSNGEAQSDEATDVEISREASAADNSKQDAKDQRRSLFVRSLPASVTTERLAEHFSQSYPIKHATVVLDKSTGISRGFGFVTFADTEDAQDAVQKFNDTVLDGRKIKVEVAESRQREVAEDIVTGRSTGSVNTKGEELRSQRQKQQEANRPPKLIVRNLPWSIKTSDDLAKLFMSYGKIKHAVVPTRASKENGGTQTQAGFGIVILRGQKNAEKALEGVNGKEVDGRVLAVDWAVDKETWEKVKQVQSEASENKGPNADGDPVGKTQIADGRVDDATSSEGSDSGVADAELIDAEISDEDHVDHIDGGSSKDDNEEDDDESSDMEELADTENGKSLVPSNDQPDSNDTTIFIRNLPFTCDDDALFTHFKTIFGPVRYARVVYDAETERSRGTGFVSFYSEDIAKDCVKNAPKRDGPTTTSDNKNDKKRKGELLTHSVLQNEMSDPSGRYTLEGRILQITRALPKLEADRRADESSKKRFENKRRLYLLSEGTIPKGSALYNMLGKAEMDIRESSARQRQKLVKENPNLGLSLTRLSVRNIPRSVTSKELKALARESVVGFAKDVKDGKRQALSREELTRGGIEEKEAERIRKEKGTGIVKQIKIVFESEKTGGKVGEGKGGRSRGYGFIEYHSHRHALMGLRWLNGHLIKAKVDDGETRNKRLIIEFAIENAQVVQRRAEREKRVRDNGPREDRGIASRGHKRKRDSEPEKGTVENGSQRPGKTSKDQQGEKSSVEQEEKNKIAARNRIIAQKRQKRKTRKGRS